MLRAGHPEHFVLNPGSDGIEVVENVGETDLPWRIFYRALPDDAFPMRWDASYPVRFGAEIVDGDGLRVGYTMHQSRDAAGRHAPAPAHPAARGRAAGPGRPPPAPLRNRVHQLDARWRGWKHRRQTHEAGSCRKAEDGAGIARVLHRHRLAADAGGRRAAPTRSTWPGSRSIPARAPVWHTHPRGQVLIATTGVGRYQSDGGPVLALQPGDSVTIPAGEKHWHGAAPDQLFVHTSIQAEGDDGEQATWLEPVGDADYTRLPERDEAGHV